MSFLTKYNTIVAHAITVVQAVSGLENVTISRGTPNTPNTRPHLHIRHTGTESEDMGNIGFENTTTLTLSIDALWEEEADFIAKLDLIIDAINTGGRDACGVEQIWVSSATWEEEQKQYIRGILTITSMYYTPSVSGD